MGDSYDVMGTTLGVFGSVGSKKSRELSISVIDVSQKP